MKKRGLSKSKRENGNCRSTFFSMVALQKPFIIPIPGSRKTQRIEVNFKSAEIILSKDEISAIDAKSDTMHFDVFGGHSAR